MDTRSGADRPTRPEALGHRTVEEAIVEKLREAIVTGAARPGEKLAYRELATHFGVSITPVRIALRELAKEGLIELRAHAGARVASLSLEDLEEIMVVRIGIESWLARWGAPEMADLAIGEMSLHLEALRQAELGGDRAAYLQASWLFRSCCYAAAAKPRLYERGAALYELSMRYHFLALAEAPRIEQSRRFMEELLAACRERDGLAAQAAIRGAMEHTLSHLSEELLAAAADTA